MGACGSVIGDDTCQWHKLLDLASDKAAKNGEHFFTLLGTQNTEAPGPAPNASSPGAK